MNGATTYSFKDLVGAMVFALYGEIIIAGGNVGTGQVSIEMLTESTELETASDGSVMTSAIPGESAAIVIDCQQTSSLHKALLAARNLNLAAMNAGDVSQWATGTGEYRNVVDGTSHTATGISFSKIPPKVYGSRGAMVQWRLFASYCVNLAA